MGKNDFQEMRELHLAIVHLTQTNSLLFSLASEVVSNRLLIKDHNVYNNLFISNETIYVVLNFNLMPITRHVRRMPVLIS